MNNNNIVTNAYNTAVSKLGRIGEVASMEDPIIKSLLTSEHIVHVVTTERINSLRQKAMEIGSVLLIQKAAIEDNTFSVDNVTKTLEALQSASDALEEIAISINALKKFVSDDFATIH